MKKMMVMFILLSVLAGCGQQNEKYTALPKGQDERFAQIEQVLDEQQEIEHAYIAVVEQNILIAIQINPWQRWQKQKVEEKVKKEVEQRLPSQDVTISTDFKLHWEVGKLKETEPEQLKKEMKKLADLAKEEA